MPKDYEWREDDTYESWWRRVNQDYSPDAPVPWWVEP